MVTVPFLHDLELKEEGKKEETFGNILTIIMMTKGRISFSLSESKTSQPSHLPSYSGTSGFTSSGPK